MLSAKHEIAKRTLWESTNRTALLMLFSRIYSTAIRIPYNSAVKIVARGLSCLTSLKAREQTAQPTQVDVSSHQCRSGDSHYISALNLRTPAIEQEEEQPFCCALTVTNHKRLAPSPKEEPYRPVSTKEAYQRKGAATLPCSQPEGSRVEQYWAYSQKGAMMQRSAERRMKGGADPYKLCRHNRD